MSFDQYENLEDLKQVQLLCTQILGELDRVCRKLNIHYVVYGGTAIGAVRHHGFIPWDDDVDVCMARNDYEKFLKEAPKEIGHEYLIANSRTEPYFPCTFSYMGLSETSFVPEFYKECEYKKPLSIDVFPLDRVPDNRRSYKRQALKTWFWGRLAYLRATSTPYLSFGGIKRGIVLICCRIVHALLVKLRIDMRFIQGKWDLAAQQFDGNSELTMFADYCDADPLRWSISERHLFDTIDVPFESITVQIPRAYDEILTRGYGDYMTLPPVDQRKNHKPFLLDFGPYEKN